jgi:hypothetical protein
MGCVAAEDLSKKIVGRVTNGGSPNLAVDGSSTPVQFTYDADGTDDIAINGLRFVASALEWKFELDHFGNGNELTNGLLLEIRANGGGSYVEVGNFKISEHFIEWADAGSWSVQPLGSDLLVAELLVCGMAVLEGGSSDQVRVTVRDDLTDVGLYRASLVVRGTKV